MKLDSTVNAAQHASKKIGFWVVCRLVRAGNYFGTQEELVDGLGYECSRLRTMKCTEAFHIHSSAQPRTFGC